MTESSLEHVYKKHHESKRRYGQTVFEDERGNLLREYIGKGKKVLDIGCRDGKLTSEYAEGNAVLGIDIDTQALDKAWADLGIETKQVDLNGEWGVESDAFDVVVAGEVMEHLYFPHAVSEKAAHVLKKNGVFIGSVPNAFNLKNRFRLLLGQKKHTPLSDPTHINHFTYRELEKVLSEHFNDVEIVPIGRWAKYDKFMPGMFSFDLFFVARNKK